MRVFGSAYGVPFALEVADETLLDAAIAHLPPGWMPLAGAPDAPVYSIEAGRCAEAGELTYSLRVGSAFLQESSRLEFVLHEFESHLQLHVAEMAPERVFVHAGVVTVNGRAILFPGRSFSGKTTMVAELVRRGAGYYSDEYAVLDDTGLVHAYPRRLSIRPEGVTSATRQRVAVPHAASRVGAEVGAIFCCRFRPDAVWNPEPLTPGQGALELVSNAVPARRSPERVLGAVSAATARALILRTDRGEAAVAADDILRVLAGFAPSSHEAKLPRGE